MIKNHENEMKHLRDTANEQFSSLIKSQHEQILQLTDIQQKTLIENERTITALRTEMKATEADVLEKEARLKEQKQHIMAMTISLQEMEDVNKSLVKETNRSQSSTQEDYYWDVQTDQDDLSSHHSGGTTTSYQMARELARRDVPSVKVNALNVDKSRQKARHVTPPFTGVGARGWLQQLKKLIKYHKYSNEDALMELMISMQGAANDWWLTLSETQ
ncbi:hypothetical protein BD560DRAFT_441409 [Blakeslea trispora]|nr:hypothetical protein BD560DRAFT_441409 [Blakeslea trispora]